MNAVPMTKEAVGRHKKQGGKRNHEENLCPDPGPGDGAGLLGGGFFGEGHGSCGQGNQKGLDFHDKNL